MIAFTKTALPFGWLGNMSAHQLEYNGKIWRTAEALFQALRFKNEIVIEAIRAERSPMIAKAVASEHEREMIVERCDQKDLDNMRLVLRLKVEQHPELKTLLLSTGDEIIVEDCTRRRASRWGAQFINGEWVGDNLLGKLWMELRDNLRKENQEVTGERNSG